MSDPQRLRAETITRQLCGGKTPDGMVRAMYALVQADEKFIAGSPPRRRLVRDVVPPESGLAVSSPTTDRTQPTGWGTVNASVPQPPESAVDPNTVTPRVTEAELTLF